MIFAKNATLQRYYGQVSVLTILMLAFTLRLYHLTYQPLWVDENDVIRFATRPLPDIVSKFYAPGWNGPLYHLVLYYWFRLAGTSAFSLRYFSLLWSILCVALAYPLGRRIIGLSGGLGLSLLLAISPYLSWYAQDGKMYSLLLFLSTMSILVLLEIYQQASWKTWFAFFVVTWAGWYVHILAALLIPVYFVLWVSYSKRFFKWSSLAWLIILGLLYLPLSRWQLSAWLSPNETNYSFYNLDEIVRTQLYVFSVGYPSIFQFVTGPILIGLFIVGIQNTLLAKCKQRLLLWYFAVPLLSLYLISFGRPIYTDRYLITIAPAFYGLCVVGLLNLWERRHKLTICLLVLVTVCSCLTIYLQANTIIKPITPNLYPLGN